MGVAFGTNKTWLYKNYVTNGLILNLDAANSTSYPGSGTTWYDISGNASNATLSNGPVYGTTGGGSFLFDEVDDFASGTLSSTPTTDTKIIWFYGLSFLDDNEYLIDMGGNIQWIQIYQNTIRAGNNGSGSGYLDGVTTLAQNTWYCVAVTTDGANKAIYLNGVLDSSSNDRATEAFTNTYDIARYSGDFSVNFNGYIAQVMIYNRVLSTEEIMQNFNAQRGRFGI